MSRTVAPAAGITILLRMWNRFFCVDLNVPFFDSSVPVTEIFFMLHNNKRGQHHIATKDIKNRIKIMTKQTMLCSLALSVISIMTAQDVFAKGYCTGFVSPCNYYDRREELCLKTLGCRYISGGVYDKSCVGTAVPCDRLKDYVNNEQAHKTSCENTAACYWVNLDQ